MTEFSDYAWLIGDEAAAILQAVAEDERPALRQLKGLRRDLSVERARLVVEQVNLRRRAFHKFGELAAKMYFTPVHLEQATDLCIATYKAGRLAGKARDLSIHDYCCGVGGDMTGLATRGAYSGWDKSPVACLLATANLELLAPGTGRIECADVSELTTGANEAWHCDPDRRPGGARTTTAQSFSPPPETIDRWRQSCSRGILKLAPATEPTKSWSAEGELEWISSGGECRQLVAWFDATASEPGRRRATRVVQQACGDPLGGSVVGEPDVACEASPSPKPYIYDVDPAVLAARLLGELARKVGLAALGAGGSYLTGDERVNHPLLQSFQVEQVLPLRTDAIAQHLAGQGVGRLEIKKRGVTMDLEGFRRRLKLHGDNEATVILTRVGKRQIAIIARRLPEAAVLPIAMSP
jgi:hypothetical protein